MFGYPPMALSPSLERVEEAGRAILREFNPRKIIFLSPQGKWRENPLARRDRACHTLLFQLWQKGENSFLHFMQSAFPPFLEGEAWALAQKIWQESSAKEGSASSRPEPNEDVDRSLPFLIPLEGFLRVVQVEALRLNAEAFVPEWDAEARARKVGDQQKLGELVRRLEDVLSAEERQKFQEISARLKKENAALIEPLARTLSEEEKVTETIEELLKKASSQKNKEDIYALILEKIQPPMGIITKTSMTLFFPCLRLLLDPRVDTASGIPYMASVILSYFQDPRSCEPLLQALELYPAGCTKIRENIIYTLGNLREARAVKTLAKVLEEPDEKKQTSPSGETVSLLLEQKEEAIWALGKIGQASVEAVSQLVKYANHPSAKLKSYLAWTLGEVGRAQKEQSGGVDARIVIALLTLLKEKNKQIFEGAVDALRKIQMPEFVHSLYLYHAGAISILGLKPAQRGLYELSETLHHLLQTKPRTIMAVNGDSGTGKTYFCQAIVDGFSGLQPHEILYLMRDTGRGQRVFNRLLGLKWLKKHIDPAYYQDYPLSEEEDNPEAFFREFLEENADKRLIILDGCRDRHYFQRVIDFFYQQGELDVEVNFRANFSTRRLNLEEREFALESVKLHLAFLEEPALEDTSFYQEGIVILYDLDNSCASRLNRQETKELFEKKRIDSWGELIRIGDFRGETKALTCEEETLRFQEESFSVREENWPESRVSAFLPEERKFKPLLNEDLAAEPNLLLTLPLEDLGPKYIRFYAQDQVAGVGEKGNIFVLTFLDNRIFHTAVEKVSGFALLGRTLYLASPGRGFLSLSFERNEIAEVNPRAPLRIASFPPDRIITAEEDGTIRVWDGLERKIYSFAGGLEGISSLAVDHGGRIYASGLGGGMRQWDLERRRMRSVEGKQRAVHLRPYPYGRLLAVEDGGSPGAPPVLRIVDFSRKISQSIPVPVAHKMSGVNVYFDGRIIAGLFEAQTGGSSVPKNLLVLTPQERTWTLTFLSGHGRGTKDCLAMGSKIITCGEEADGRPSLRLWGSEFYVKTELGKLFIKP